MLFYGIGRALDQDFVSTEQTETVGLLRSTPNSGREIKCLPSTTRQASA
jgi:hypothetical protein